MKTKLAQQVYRSLEGLGSGEGDGSGSSVRLGWGFGYGDGAGFGYGWGESSGEGDGAGDRFGSGDCFKYLFFNERYHGSGDGSGLC